MGDLKPDIVQYDFVPLLPEEMSPGQKMMVEDGLPSALVRQPKQEAVDMATIGPKEQQIRDLPGRQKPASTKTAPAKPAAVATPKPAEPAQQETTTMKTGTGKQKTKKGDPKKTSAKKAPTTTRRQKPARAASAARQAAPKTEGVVRPGSKLEKIVGLLQRPDGCTTAQVLAACNWPSVSMPQQAKAAGITLHKEKVEGVTVYRDAATVKGA